MNKRKYHVLYIEDNPLDVELIRRLLAEEKGHAFEIEHADRLSKGIKRLKQGSYDCILLDLGLPDGGVELETYKKISLEAPNPPIVLITGTYLEEQTALEAVQQGAQDYLVKGEFDGRTLARTVLYAIERKHGEQALQDSLKRLEHLGRVKTQFVAQLSYKLLSRLMGIVQGMSLLREGKLGTLSAEQRLFFTHVDEEVTQLIQLVDQLLTSSKIEGEEPALARRRIELKPFIEERLKVFQIKAGKRNLEFELPPVPPVFADPERISQVLENLLTTCIELTEETGTITLRLGRENENYTKVFLEAHGQTIPEADLSKLLESVSSKGLIKTRGAPSGLVIAKRLVEYQKGIFSITSEEGKGSRFSFTLPTYTQDLALAENFQDFLEATRKAGKPEGALILIDSSPLLSQGIQNKHLDPVDGLWKLVELSQSHLLQGEKVLAIEPHWIVIFSMTNTASEARMEVQKIQTILEQELGVALGTPLEFGVSFYPKDGTDARSLFNRTLESCKSTVTPS